MNYNQFWNNNTIEDFEEILDVKEDKDIEKTEEVETETNEDISWEEEFDIDENEESQEYINDYDDSDNESYSFLSEQEEIEDSETEEEMIDDSEQYSVNSLFDYDDEDLEQDEPVFETPAFETTVVDSIIEPVEEQYVEEQPFEEQPVEEPAAEEPAAKEPAAEEPVEEQYVEEQPFEEQPVQESVLPPILEEIFNFIPSYCSFGTLLKTLSESDVNDIASFIAKTRDSWISDGKEKMFNIPDSEISVAVLNDVSDPLTRNHRIQSLGIQMFAAEKQKWSCVNLFFEKDGKLRKAEIEEITQDSFEDWQWKIVQYSGFELWKSRQK